MRYTIGLTIVAVCLAAMPFVISNAASLINESVNTAGRASGDVMPYDERPGYTPSKGYEPPESRPFGEDTTVDVEWSFDADHPSASGEAKGLQHAEKIPAGNMWAESDIDGIRYIGVQRSDDGRWFVSIETRDDNGMSMAVVGGGFDAPDGECCGASDVAFDSPATDSTFGVSEVTATITVNGHDCAECDASDGA